MSMLDGFAPDARRAIVRAGALAAQDGHATLGTDFLLLALAERPPRGTSLGITPEAVRADIQARTASPRRDRELLAAIGIDLDEVRRRAFEATGLRPDDPSLWRLRRSRLRPLRVTLTGPAAELPLDRQGRKAVEVAQWAARRRRRTLVNADDLLWGLLADGSNASVGILRKHGVDLRRLWGGLHGHPEAA
ncbi:Clp protease N-terminal domain-containing protein [Spirillospora sp. NPDC050679]